MPRFHRRAVLAGFGVLLAQIIFRIEARGGETSNLKFDRLSTHGNSNCSTEFLASIPKMQKSARLQGSCCSAMERTRYEKQVMGLKKYNAITDIPSDPYDIEAGLAAKLLTYYDLALSEGEQKAYDFAMANSEEKGPCCCRCWRWNAYGGLAKLLIREHGFNGDQVTEVWDLSNGCGGGE